MKSRIFLLLILISVSCFGQDLTGVKIYVNPGHGGFDSDDRNIVIAPYTSGDHNGFWESQSNLDKGQQLQSMLLAAGATVYISRTTNTTADDLPLSQIVAMANSVNADFMLAIHSNAGSGVANYVLQLYAGKDANDQVTYPTATPVSDESRAICNIIAQNQYSNKLTTWTSGYQVVGDKTFARTIMGWSDGYGVLRGLAVPGTISEGMMHDYIPETYRLMNMDYKWLEAWQFYKSFCTYFNAGAITTGNIAGQVRDSRIKLESTYNKLAGQDQMLPLNGAKVTLVETGEFYTVDQLQNGLFFFKNLAPGTYHILAENDGYHNQTQEITVTANNTSYYNFALNRVRNTPPQVITYTPNVTNLNDSVDASTDIVLQFNWDMDEASTTAAFTITPTASGKFTFEDTNYTLRFTPDKPLDKETVYTVTLAKSASHPDNLSMENDFSFQFLTKNRNRLSLLMSNPYDGNEGVYYVAPAFRLIFDRKLNTSNLQSAIWVEDESGTLTKIARSVVNNSVTSPYGSSYFSLASNLTEGKEYKLVVSGDVEDEIGMKVVEPIEIRFKAVNVAKTGPEVKETFELAALTYNSAVSADVTTATIVASSATKLFGSYANRIQTSFGSFTAEAVFNFNNPAELSSEKVVGLHVFGDLTGNELWLKLTSSASEEWVKMCDLNFFGWEFHELNLENLIPAGTYSIAAIKVKRSNSYGFSTSSDIYLDNLLVYDDPLSSVNQLETSIRVYPNPVSSVVVAETSSVSNTSLQLFTLHGVKLQEVKTNRMDVRNVTAGTYLLKVFVNGEVYSKPLIIVH